MNAFTDHRSPIRVTDAMRERLAAGVTMYLAADYDNDNICGPKWVQMQLNLGVFERLLRLRELCVDGEIEHVATLKVWPSRWDDEGTDVTVNSWKAMVDDSEFWLCGTPKHSSGASTTHRLPLRYLATALAAEGQQVPDDLGDMFAWYGGSLTFNSNGVEDFIADIEAGLFTSAKSLRS
jgi:hypothetical protein